MNAKILEEKINKKFGTKGNFTMDENFSLIRAIEDNSITIMRLDVPGDGLHLLKDAKQGEVNNISKYFKFTDENDDDDDLIPNDKPKTLTPEEKRQQEIDNELVPDDDDKGKPGDNDLIPD